MRKGVHLAVELFADPADLVFADALQPQCLGERVDVASAHAVDVRLLDHGQQRPFVPATRFEQRLEVTALTQLRNRELDGAHPGVPFPLPKPVSRRDPLVRPLVRRRSDRLGDFRVHELLHQQPEPVPKKLRIRPLLILAQQVQECHPEIGHRCGPPKKGLKQLLGTTRWPFLSMGLRDLHHYLLLNFAPRTRGRALSRPMLSTFPGIASH